MKKRTQLVTFLARRRWASAARRSQPHRSEGLFMKKPKSLPRTPTFAAVFFSSVMLLGTFALSGCDSSDSKATAATESANVDALPVPGGALSEEMVGQTVAVTGKVVEQCPASGCWLRVEAGGGATFVDLLPSSGRLSQNHVGEQAEITGEVVRRGSNLAIQARRVEFKSGSADSSNIQSEDRVE